MIRATHNKEKTASSSAFTIVELLIVIVVIAILAAITLVSYNGITQRARDSAVQSIANQIGTTVQTNQATSSSNLPYADNEVNSRADALANIGIESLSADACVRYYVVNGNVGDDSSGGGREYYDTCNPELVNGQVLQYDKTKVYVSYTRYADAWSGVIVTAPSLSQVAVSYWSYSLNSWVKRDISVGIGWYSGDYYNYDKTYQAETDDASLRCDPFGYSDYGGHYNDGCVYYYVEAN